MATCKDCVHYEPCRDTYYNNEEQTRIPFDFLEKDGVDKDCAFFKDRSKIVELQCNIGQTVYAYCEDLHEILEYRIYCASVFRENSITYHADCYDEENDEALSEIGFEPDDIGEFVFFTREEVEQALKEGENNDIQSE